MGRLIDAEIQTDYIVEHDLAFEYAIQHQDRKELERLIAEIPTAYDTDKVVQKIKESSIRERGEIKTEDVITIVKGGGVE